MRYLLLFAFLIGCGTDIDNRRTRHRQPAPEEYIKVASVTLNVGKSEGLNAAAQSITYTTPNQNNVDLDLAALKNAITESDESTDGLTIDLGSLTLTGIKINKLKICGVGGNEQCTSAIIRVYTNAITSHPAGETGFINKTDSYGVPRWLIERSSWCGWWPPSAREFAAGCGLH